MTKLAHIQDTGTQLINSQNGLISGFWFRMCGCPLYELVTIPYLVLYINQLILSYVGNVGY